MATASMASDFADATLAPLPALLPTLAPAWQRLGQPGSWWSGAERLALAHEARAARDCALCAQRKQALSPYSIDEHHVATRELPDERLSHPQQELLASTTSALNECFY